MTHKPPTFEKRLNSRLISLFTVQDNGNFRDSTAKIFGNYRKTRSHRTLDPLDVNYPWFLVILVKDWTAKAVQHMKCILPCLSFSTSDLPDFLHIDFDLNEIKCSFDFCRFWPYRIVSFLRNKCLTTNEKCFFIHSPVIHNSMRFSWHCRRINDVP